MSTFTLLHRGLSPASINSSAASFSPAKQPTISLPFLSKRVWSIGTKEEQGNLGVRLRCKTSTKDYKDVSPNDLPIIKQYSGIVENTAYQTQLEAALDEDWERKKIEQHVDAIRSMLGSMGDGEINISAYDTAWVALVEDMEGSGTPQFPSSLEWIANNQHQDGSWGDSSIFEAHDRIINTLGCVIALRSWFEIAFPALIEKAKKLDIQVPDSPVLQEIYARRNLKLIRIPRDIMHKVPTTLLHSLEGMDGQGLQWEKLLKLQCQDGSFLFSPSSTAFALMETKDVNCLRYLTRIVETFNGGVPNVYPVDLFEHMWAVDRLERLGISRYFKSEIKECVDYVHRYWNEEGICWARNSVVHDIDDTSMGFRLLRLHGYPVSADVFGYFKKGDEFFCFAGQSTQAVTGMYNLYRASNISFPGEKILEDANEYSTKFLREKQACNELLDKWIVTKDLPGEVGYALDVPWYASLPRLEARFYLEHYGGEDDVWIGKTLYRMPYVNNNTYLELAKLDYNKCQALHQQEWHSIQNQTSLLLAYYLAAATIFEPERSNEQLAWAKTATLVEMIAAYFEKEGNSSDQRRAFVREFRNSGGQLNYENYGRQVNINHYTPITFIEHVFGVTSRYNKTTGNGLLGTLIRTIDQLSLNTLEERGRDIHHNLLHAWELWMKNWEGGDMYEGEAELLVSCINLCSNRWVTGEVSLPPVSNSQYKRLSDVTNRVCHQLRRQFQHNHMIRDDKDSCHTTNQIESDMQELVQLVLCFSPNDIDPETKQIFLAVAKSFYYSAHCTLGTIHFHIAKVLFERVM
ncbi:hypothetical protein Vadar_017731 [Vaccinium darrowii]|uniref:Uncharacterized protein n=1 Tax=Vaccinium darrowii TaxID=229202 RepID=A0ACB7ZCH2_9ERIC|nr:hypothetical protein Vadar_017731 [Vaccinium darrowii]